VGTALEVIDDDEFRRRARAAWDEFGRHPASNGQWDDFALREAGLVKDSRIIMEKPSAPASPRRGA
jgi:hypothetical protein